VDETVPGVPGRSAADMSNGQAGIVPNPSEFNQSVQWAHLRGPSSTSTGGPAAVRGRRPNRPGGIQFVAQTNIRAPCGRRLRWSGMFAGPGRPQASADRPVDPSCGSGYVQYELAIPRAARARPSARSCTAAFHVVPSGLQTRPSRADDTRYPSDLQRWSHSVATLVETESPQRYTAPLSSSFREGLHQG